MQNDRYTSWLLQFIWNESKSNKNKKKSGVKGEKLCFRINQSKSVHSEMNAWLIPVSLLLRIRAVLLNRYFFHLRGFEMCCGNWIWVSVKECSTICTMYEKTYWVDRISKFLSRGNKNKLEKQKSGKRLTLQTVPGTYPYVRVRNTRKIIYFIEKLSSSKI